MPITDWPENERPRERMLNLGPQALSDAELLAIFLRMGIKGKSAVDLARELLEHCDGSVARLVKTPAAELARLPGLGLAKATQLAATIELSRRALAEEMKQRDLLGSPAAVRDWLKLKIGHLAHEAFYALWLNTQNQLIESDEVSHGTLAQTSVYPREIVKLALSRNASAVIFAHNHPSGVSEPSNADRQLTKALKDALALIDVRVLDHFIVAGNHHLWSFAEHGEL